MRSRLPFLSAVTFVASAQAPAAKVGLAAERRPRKDAAFLPPPDLKGRS